jgi:hypothetical protein
MNLDPALRRALRIGDSHGVDGSALPRRCIDQLPSRKLCGASSRRAAMDLNHASVLAPSLIVGSLPDSGGANTRIFAGLKKANSPLSTFPPPHSMLKLLRSMRGGTGRGRSDSSLAGRVVRHGGSSGMSERAPRLACGDPDSRLLAARQTKGRLWLVRETKMLRRDSREYRT